MKKNIMIVLVLLITVVSCNKKQPASKKITKGNFTLELVKQIGSLCEIKIEQTCDCKFAYATPPITQGDVKLEQLIFVYSSSTTVKDIAGGGQLVLYEYETDNNGDEKIKKTETIPYVLSAFQ